MANSNEREAKKLAVRLVWVKVDLNNEKLREWEEKEAREEYSKILREALDLGYTESMLIPFLREYKQVKFGDYQKWLDGELLPYI